MSINLKDSKQIQINILTRSANRPLGFYNCYQSVVNQTYKKVNHLVSYEDDIDLEYIDYAGVNKVKVEKYKGNKLTHPKGYLHAPYNLYCNELMRNVDKGWIMFLDDDDHLRHNKVLKELVSEIMKADEDTIFIWQMRYPNGIILPNSKHFKSQKIEINYIGSPCFIFHSKYKNFGEWDEWKASDYRVIKRLLEEIPKSKWIEKVYIQINNYGGFGNRNDIVQEVKRKIVFKKTWMWYLFPKYHTQINSIYIFQLKTYQQFLIKGLERIKKFLK